MLYFHTLTFQIQKIIFNVNIADIMQDYFRIVSLTMNNSCYEFIFWSETALKCGSETEHCTATIRFISVDDH